MTKPFNLNISDPCPIKYISTTPADVVILSNSGVSWEYPLMNITVKIKVK
jgi:hypothetical protein